EWNSGEKKSIDLSLAADDSVKTGVYNIYLKFNYSNKFGERSSETVPVALRVIGSPKLVISKIYTSPERVFPEDEFSLNIILENSGTDDAKNTNLIIELPDYFEGEKTKFSGTIERGSSKTVTFNLKAGNETPVGEHSFPLKVKFEDLEGVAHKAEYEVPVYISSLGKISLDIAGVYTSPDVPVSGENYKLSVQIENSGNQNAKAVSIQLVLPPDFEGKDTHFIGSLESGDSATASFNLKAGSQGNHNIKVVIKYMDSKFEQHEVSRSITHYVSSKSYSGEIAGSLVVLAVILILVYKFRKK
ncbi:MAG TPA: hypothetical protein EYP30_00390, partial [Archaeoglobaceae archaeon]|nr:hypothetical protein [Archaeoglobaceae archaeon]